MTRVGARVLRTWVPLGGLLSAVGCAAIVDLTGDFQVEETGGGAGESGASGANGGSNHGGTSNGGSQTGGTENGGAGENGGEGGTDSQAGSSGRGGSNHGGAGPIGGSSGTKGGAAGAPTGGSTSGGAGASGGGAGMGGIGTGGSAGMLAPSPSCEGGIRTCGEHGNLDCCAAPLLPAGEFDRGNDPRFPALLAEFRLDAYEVTVARFRRFVAAFAAGYRPAPGSGKNPNNPNDQGWQQAWDARLPSNGAGLAGSSGELRCNETYQTWTTSPGDNESRPINCVSWYVANAFCIWDGGRLPTEAEWNYAAAGGEHQRVYPWSSPPSSESISELNASYYVDSFLECRGDYVNGCSLADLIPVGTRPNGNAEFGQADMSGNVYEWVQDGFSTLYENPCNNCANLADDGDRVLRGGCFSNYYALMRTDFRINWAPDDPDGGIGIRCARSP